MSVNCTVKQAHWKCRSCRHANIVQNTFQKKEEVLTYFRRIVDIWLQNAWLVYRVHCRPGSKISLKVFRNTKFYFWPIKLPTDSKPCI